MANEYEPDRRALAQFLGVDPETVHEAYDEWECETVPGSYLVLTDDEAQEVFKARVRDYIDDCMDIPENIRPYFDEEAFIRDVQIGDGRGPTMAPYDGAEEEAEIDGEWYFIYRQN